MKREHESPAVSKVIGVKTMVNRGEVLEVATHVLGKLALPLAPFDSSTGGGRQAAVKAITRDAIDYAEGLLAELDRRRSQSTETQ